MNLILAILLAGKVVLPGPVPPKRVEAGNSNVHVYYDGGAYGIYSTGGGLPVEGSVNVTVTADGGSFGVACIPASGVSGGCVTTDFQSFVGPKNFINYVTIDGGLTAGNGVREDWDGGPVVGEVSAKSFVAYQQFYARFADSGYQMASFNCSGIGGDGHANGQPCLTNPYGIVEIYGHTTNTAQESLGQTDGLCPVEIYDMGAAVLSDGGSNVGPSVCLANITQDKMWRMMRNGDVKMDGSSMLMRGGQANIAVITPSVAGLQLSGRVGAGGGKAAAGIYLLNAQQLGNDDDVVEILGPTGLWRTSWTGDGSWRAGKMTTGAESTCPGTSSMNVGSSHFNTDLNAGGAMRVCTASGWETSISQGQGATIVVDGGFQLDGQVISTFSESGSVTTGHANFRCDNNPAASSPCLANFLQSTEIGGKTSSPLNPASSDVYIGAMQNRTTGQLLVVLNNYGLPGERSKWEVEWNGDTTQDGSLLIGANSSDGRISTVAGSLYLNSTGGPLIQWNHTSGDVVEFFSGAGGTEVVDLTSDGTFKTITGGVQPVRHALHTCGSTLEGRIETDVLSGLATGKRTKSCLCTSDGSSVYKWQNLATGTLGTTTTCGTE